METDVSGDAVAAVVDMPLERGHAEAHHRAALDLRGQPLRVNDGAAVGDAEVIDDLESAGLDVELDLDEAGGERGDGSVAGEVVAGDADEAGAGQVRDRGRGDGIEVVGDLVR